MGSDTRLNSSVSRPTALWAVQVMTFLCSIGTGLVMNGVFYLTKSAYGFGMVENLWLALVMGFTYIAGAKGAGPGVRALRRLTPWITSRGILAVLMLAMAAPLMLPTLAPTSKGPDGTLRSAWVVWVMVLIYSPMTGVLWPMMESFLSGGRSGKTLRSAIGMWNVVWSGAILVPFLGVSALVTRDAALGFAGLGAIHVLCALFLVTFEREPAPHLAEEHEPHPPVYAQLLVVFRMLLPMGYFVFSALNPILPALMGSIGIGEAWRPIVAMAWLGSRTAMFGVLRRWQGWHGRWGFPIAGAACLVGGFALAVLSPLLGPGAPAVAMMTGGLMVFGVGMGIVYSGAIYYAMEVGKAELDAGGTHEALIGVGYVGGPGCGLLACEVVRQGVVSEDWFEVLVLGVVGAIALAIAVYAVRHARRKARG